MKFENTFFINGTAYAGKSTMVKRLAEKYDGIACEENPELAIKNFRQSLMRINSRENYDSFLHSGFRVIVRDENRSIEDTFALVEKELGLQR